ncbi:calmodulin-like protein 8 isoform X2 [Protopterus annectens]|uniref:calmodulin-like protein 8 isoform X2 n=1 Tax=Protopterus annectens TaxID=7888 RepID=UPI001CFB6E85|nr:calmodulin-like protein 8 isoform X2 [Protopterus annectens]
MSTNFQEKECKKDFPLLDGDDSGYLKPGEIYEVCKSLNINVTLEKCNQLVAAYDTSGDGQLSCDEFIAAMQPRPK